MSAHSGYETHRQREALPLLEGEALDALVADIRANGLINPITLIDGRMILDCRNGIRVCIAAAARGRRTPSSSATRARKPKKEGHSRDSASGPRTAPTGLQ